MDCVAPRANSLSESRPPLRLAFLVRWNSPWLLIKNRKSKISRGGSYNDSMEQHPDVLILGGGVIGLTTAYFLARSQVSALVIDRGDFGQESSWAGAGILSPAPAVDHARTPRDLLHAHSARLFPQLAADLEDETGVDNGYRVCGGYELFDPSEPVHPQVWKDAGITGEEISPSDLPRREPALNPGSHRVYFFPATAQV